MAQAARRRRSVVVVAAVALLASLFTPVMAGVAAAAPGKPIGLSPAGGVNVGKGNPQLSWQRDPTVTRYRVYVATDPSLTQRIVNGVETTNTTFTHPEPLPGGTLYWAVQGRDASGWGELSDVAHFEKDYDAPTLVAPDHEATLKFPQDKPTFSWLPVPGAKGYILEIDDAPDFIGSTTITTKSTTYTLTNAQTVDQPWYWRVRGSSNGSTNGVLTDYSEIRSYTIEFLQKPVLVSPPNTVPLTSVRDVELVWEPVVGAQHYIVEVSINEDFTGTSVVPPTTVYGTRFSPPINRSLDNGSYHWRVRAVAAGGHQGPWSDVSTFTRGWPDQVHLVYPPHNELALDPVRFEWTPATLASDYQIQVSNSPNFDTPPPYTASCITNQTIYMPHTRFTGGHSPGGCDLLPNLEHGTTYYWRVRGLDAPRGYSTNLWSETRSFIRRQPIPNRVAPLNGATVATPFLDWDPVPNVERYRVRIFDKNNNDRVNQVTYATSYTPTTALNPADGPFKWYVTTIGYDGREGLIPNESTWSTFSLSPVTGPSPEAITPADGAASHEAPAMTWQAVAGATKYEVWYSVQGSGVEQRLTDAPRNAGYTHTGSPGTPLTPGTYQWYVKAFAGNTLLAAGTPRTFVVTSLEPAGAVVNPPPCPPNLEDCEPVRSSPVFEWPAVPGATRYQVTLAFDRFFTNVDRVYQSGHNAFIPREELPDNDAGQAYYWYVQPCFGGCPPPPQAANVDSYAFLKQSEPVPMHEPAHGAKVANQPRFAWSHYLESNSTDLEAESYQIQVATEPTFASPIDDKTVDQPFYTPYDRTYPEGPLYWRVRPIDGSGNRLQWSYESKAPLTYRSFVKESPAPTMLAPSNTTINGIPTFEWEPQVFAKAYVLEVYKNGDLNFSPANRLQGYPLTTVHTRYTPQEPLPPGTYAWRVRREDGQDKDGPWPTAPNGTPTGFLFTVTGSAPTPLAPNNGTTVENDDVVFTWTEAPGAASYRFEVSTNPQFTDIKDSVNTVMTSWAPRSTYAERQWYWRVHARNAADQIIGTSDVFTFERTNIQRPSAPRNLQVTRSPGRLVVRWQPPQFAGVPAFSDYRITLSPGGHARTVNKNTTQVTFNGLNNGTQYTVQVVARIQPGNKAGPPVQATGAPNGCTDTPFGDVPGGHLFCNEIRWMYQTGLSTGSVAADGTVRYLPSQAVSRDAMAAFLYRYAGSPPVPNTPPHFADVPANHLFFTPIQWMYKSGNSTGFPNPNGGKPLFKPADAVDRQSMAAFLYRAAGNPTVTPMQPFFADVNQGHIFFGPIQWMAQSGLSFGVPNPQPGGKPFYQPNVVLSREAMAAFLKRYDDLVT